MKKLYAEQKNTLYELQKKLQLDSKRLYRFCENYDAIYRMPVSLLEELALAEDIEPMKLWHKMLNYAINKK